MRAPETPLNEQERLAALRAYGVLDTAGEASFDALTKLAAGILGTPIALISLVDEGRQWFKSRYGLEAAQTPREISFCGHVVAGEQPVIVPDAHDDARFAGNPLVTGEPRIRFYAGMPLRTPDGFVLGSLCTIDHVPKQPTGQQLEMLALLAGQVVDQLEAGRKRKELLTEREAARESARRLEVLFEGLSEGVVLQDGEGRIALANGAASRLLGMTFEQLTGKTSLDPRWHAVHEDGAPFPGETHPASVALRSGKAVMNKVMGVNRADGALVWLNVNAMPLQDETEAKPHGVIVTFHDVTALRTARLAAERMARQERLVTTGTLAAGVGHEVNNPLAFVHGNLEFAIEELRNIAGASPSARLRELGLALEEARGGTERIRKIVRGLQSLSREEAPPVPSDLEASVDVAISMATHEIRHRATVMKELSPTPRVLADEARLTQALVNLLVNAGQAFAQSDIARNKVVVSSRLLPDGRVAISITDNGPGIPAGLQSRVFDPFFSTKGLGQGAGLGLSIAQSVVLSMGGELQVDSIVGKGSTFRVVLPAAQQAAPAAAPKEPVAVPRGRVLAVDDEPIILRTIARVLEKEHDVVTLEDPLEALKLLRSGETFDVIFSDLMMPGLRGDQLYSQVKQERPELAERFVFVSGGATQPELIKFLAENPNERLEKPFSVQNLRGMARRYTPAGKVAP